MEYGSKNTSIKKVVELIDFIMEWYPDSQDADEQAELNDLLSDASEFIQITGRDFVLN